jgi:hypothetical protein
MRFLIPAALAALALAGCSVGDDGPRTTQTRHVAAFTSVENRSSVDVRLRVGQPQRVRVLAGANVIDDVRTEVHGGTLRVIYDHSGWGGGGVTIEASVPKLTGVETSGSGDLDADGVHADAFAVRSDGSADIALRGTVERLTIDMGGSGDADLGRLAAHEARVDVDGSGDAEVSADRLAVDLDGSGDVRYHGDPVVSQQRDGSGDITSVR